LTGVTASSSSTGSGARQPDTLTGNDADDDASPSPTLAA
jgi:hypothetical protein